MPIELKSTLENFHNKLWSYYIPISKDIGDQFVEGDNRRVLCAINGNEPMHSALMHKDGEYTIYVNTELQQKFGIAEGDTVNVILEKDTSEFGIPMPESFEVLLAQDDEGREYFQALTMGKQRSLIYIVQKVKNVDSQLAKGLAIMHHLKEDKGALDFKRLNVLIKEYNNRR
ncbi:MAG: DUF1905 domain-containing protein [Cyclobacteriaceae bacterium]